MYNDFNNNNTPIPGLQFMSLTPEDNDDQYKYDEQDEEEYNWIDDCECQENLATILPLSPEECVIDKDNHILNVNGIKLFFEELGYLTEEPEPIDPSRDYEAEAQVLLEQRNKMNRKLHIELSSPVPSLDDNDTPTSSGISSTSSSCHQVDHCYYIGDIRSPDYNQCGDSGQQQHEAYSYAHATRSFL
ncbi:hypothetical protein K501DRAFT_285712 [Backusella circina FSU 941]|nr:hypothetical protein K501DRAFT_285712 [Backusella circina FSU 941]